MELDAEPASTELECVSMVTRCVEELLQTDIAMFADQQEQAAKRRRSYTKRSTAEKTSGAIPAGKSNRSGSRLSRHNAAMASRIQESDLERAPTEAEESTLASRVVSASTIFIFYKQGHLGIIFLTLEFFVVVRLKKCFKKPGFLKHFLTSDFFFVRLKKCFKNPSILKHFLFDFRLLFCKAQKVFQKSRFFETLFDF